MNLRIPPLFPPLHTWVAEYDEAVKSSGELGYAEYGKDSGNLELDV